jgi:hypothetical protein
MFLSVNSDYFLKQYEAIDLFNGEVSCFLWNKYYLEKLRLKVLNDNATKKLFREYLNKYTTRCGVTLPKPCLSVCSFMPSFQYRIFAQSELVSSEIKTFWQLKW